MPDRLLPVPSFRLTAPALAVALLLSACSKESTSPPAIAVDPKLVELSVGDSSAAFEVVNAGRGMLDWQLTGAAPWLAATPAAGSTSDRQQVAVTILADSLSQGPPDGVLEIDSNGGQAQVTVRMWRALQTDPLQLSLGTEESGAVAIANLTDAQFVWHAAPLEAWLAVTPDQGLLSAEPDTLTVAVVPAGLSPGEHTGLVRISAGALGEDSVQVTITVPQVASVSGHAFFDATRIPAPGVQVSIGAITDTTDEHGAYLLAMVPAGERRLAIKRKTRTRIVKITIPEE